MSTAGPNRGPDDDDGPTLSLPWDGFSSPTQWVFAKVTEFFIGLSVGLVSGIGEGILTGFLWIRDAITRGGAAVGGSFGYIGGGASWLVTQLGLTFVDVSRALGIFALPFWLIVAGGVVLLVYHAIKFILATVPSLGGVAEVLP